MYFLRVVKRLNGALPPLSFSLDHCRSSNVDTSTLRMIKHCVAAKR